MSTGVDDEQSAKARSDLAGRFTDATKLLATQLLRNEAHCAAYFRVGLQQAPVAAVPVVKEQH